MYMRDLPPDILERVSQNLNCEDIAMSFLVSAKTGGKPPLLAESWAIASLVKLYSPSKISGSHSHKAIRDMCINDFSKMLGLRDGDNTQQLQSATIRHKHSGYFDIGAPMDKLTSVQKKLMPAIPERLMLLQTKIGHLKTLSKKEVQEQVGRMRADMAHDALVKGLVEGTSPWKQRWKHGTK